MNAKRLCEWPPVCFADAAPGRKLCYSHYGEGRRTNAASKAPTTRAPLTLATAAANNAACATPPPINRSGVRHPSGGLLRTVAWDLETTSLTVLMGRVLACSFYDCETGEVWSFRADDPEFYNPEDPIDDSKLVAAIRDQIEAFDTWITWNGILFDVKFLKGRLLKANERLPEPRFHLDGMWIIRTNCRMSSKLDNVAKFLDLPEQKTPISWEVWQRAMAGHRESLDNVVIHCEADVRTTYETMRRLKQYVKQLPRRS